MSESERAALVTGAGSGLGQATARLLADRGVLVLAADRAMEGLDELRRASARITAAELDVTDAAAVRAALDDFLSRTGAVLIAAVNCAGVAYAERLVHGPDRMHSTDAFELVLKVNVLGTFNVMRAAAARMRAQAGGAAPAVIINVASAAAFDGQQGQVAYAASKGAVVSMTLPAARDLAPFGIRVVTIAPGPFATSMTALMPPRLHDALLRDLCAPARLGRPEEFAKLVWSVVDNDYLNGCVIRLDAGARLSKL